MVGPIELMIDSQLRIFAPFFVAAITVVSFLPVLHNDFVLWDDFNVIMENPNIRGFGWSHIRWDAQRENPQNNDSQ